VTPEEARTFIRDHHRGVLVTRRRHDSVQVSPVVCTIDRDGMVVVSSRETAMKVKNLDRDPRASLCVFTDDFFGSWVQVDGTAEVVRLPDAMEPLVEYYRSLSGEHPDWDDYRVAMERERRVLVRIDIERAGPSVSG
jgi:PPOX class probable F420-dependent enzyme